MSAANSKVFWDYIRRAPLGGKLSTAQINGIKAIIAYCEARSLPMVWLAYILATAFHETGGKFQPIGEGLTYTTLGALRAAFKTPFKDKPDSFLAPFLRNPQGLANYVYANRNGNGDVKSGEGYKYRGRGLVQLTFKNNYAAFGLAANPDAAHDMDTAVRVLVDGMLRGQFGKKLSAFGNDEASFDAKGARASVSSDKGALIATHYQAFLDALKSVDEVVASAAPDIDPPVPVLGGYSAPIAIADDVPATKSGIVQTILGTLSGGGILSAVAGIANPWAFGLLAILIVIGAVFAWGFFSGRINFNRV
jgi:putative chitinase